MDEKQATVKELVMGLMRIPHDTPIYSITPGHKDRVTSGDNAPILYVAGELLIGHIATLSSSIRQVGEALDFTLPEVEESK